MKNNHYRVIVIGAGIAGLTATWELKKQGIEALVLEAEKTVGGRMQSLQENNLIIDYGAQFLSSAYSIIPALIHETGLTENFVQISQSAGFVSKNGVAIINSQNPFQWITSEVFSISDILKLAFGCVKLFKFKKFNPNDITEYSKFDTELGQDWAKNHFGNSLTKKLIAPLINGFYFQLLNQSSAVLPASVLSFSAYKPKTMKLTSGMQSLPEKLAQNLNVKTEMTVNQIIENSFEMKVITNTEEYTADHVILTVPAPVTKKIVQTSDKTMLSLFETPYSTSIIISLLMNNDWIPPKKLNSVCGLLFDPDLKNKISAISFENNYQSINIMLSDEWSKKLFSTTDEEIISDIQLDIENMLPDIFKHIHKKFIHRWKHAMSCTPLNRAKTVCEYRNSRSQNNRLWLAGDYMGFPWTDSAAFTGLWAAKQTSNLLQVSKKN